MASDNDEREELARFCDAWADASYGPSQCDTDKRRQYRRISAALRAPAQGGVPVEVVREFVAAVAEIKHSDLCQFPTGSTSHSAICRRVWDAEHVIGLYLDGDGLSGESQVSQARRVPESTGGDAAKVVLSEMPVQPATAPATAAELVAAWTAQARYFREALHIGTPNAGGLLAAGDALAAALERSERDRQRAHECLDTETRHSQALLARAREDAARVAELEQKLAARAACLAESGREIGTLRLRVAELERERDKLMNNRSETNDTLRKRIMGLERRIARMMEVGRE